MRGSSQQFHDWCVQPTIDRLYLKKVDSDTTVDLLVSIAATESQGLSYLATPPRGREKPVPTFGPYRFRDDIIPLVNDAVDRALANLSDPGGADKDIADALGRFNQNYRLGTQPPDASVFVTWLDCATAYARIILWNDGTDYAPPIGDLREQYELYLSLFYLPKHPAYSLWVENRATWDGDAAALARYGIRGYCSWRKAQAEAMGAAWHPRSKPHYCGVEVPVGPS